MNEKIHIVCYGIFLKMVCPCWYNMAFCVLKVHMICEHLKEYINWSGFGLGMASGQGRVSSKRNVLRKNGEKCLNIFREQKKCENFRK